MAARGRSASQRGRRIERSDCESKCEVRRVKCERSAGRVESCSATFDCYARTRFDDVRRGNAEAIEQFLRLAAARDLAHGETVHREAGVGHRFGHRVADAARRVVILDRDQPPAGRARRRRPAPSPSTGCTEYRSMTRIDVPAAFS